MNDKLKNELNSFQSIWEGGYYEGDPLDPLSNSSYYPQGYISILYAVYLICIKPYVNSNSTVLEIGCGRGAWTKTFLPAKEIWCLDALSAEHNGFWEYVGKRPNINYFKVDDFSCSMLPENHFDYFFSFGALCHVSFEGISEYLKNIYPKLKPGATCFIMVADYDKYNKSFKEIDKHIGTIQGLEKNLHEPEHPVIRLLKRVFKTKYYSFQYQEDKNEDNIPRPGRWYNAGIERTCKTLEQLGYKVISRDLEIIARDPVIQFTK